MFEAIVIVCWLGQPACLQGTDTRGPYRRESECVARTAEMMKSLVPAAREANPGVEIASVDAFCNYLPAA